MLIAEILLEGRDAPLFHGAGVGGAIRIISDDIFKQNTAHHPKPGGLADNEEGVSLSRSLRAAFSFGEIVFKLDQRKLAQRYRIIPLDYWGHSHEPKLIGKQRRHGKYAEAEEFVIGSIEPASDYILAVCLSQKSLDRIKKNFPDSAGAIIDHPLLTIV